MKAAVQEQDQRGFEEFLSQSFQDGQTRRELRLSPAETEYLQTHCPSLTVAPLPASDGEKGWYLVSSGMEAAAHP